jgi:hypothetical protein
MGTKDKARQYKRSKAEFAPVCGILRGQELVAQGRSLAETLEIASDVAKRLMEAQVERGGFTAGSPLEERFDHPLVVSA